MRVLILACSARKRPGKGLVPAVERYNGPSFQVLRKFLRTSTEKIDVWILSAEFGLIHSSEPIPMYNRKMTIRRARELHATTIRRLQVITLDTAAPTELFVAAGKSYIEAMKGFEAGLPKFCKIEIADGGGK